MGNIDAPIDETVFDVEKEIDDLLPVEVKEKPKFFKGAHLQDLDAAEYEEAPTLPLNLATEAELGARDSFAEDGEILDEMITRSRGQVRRISSPKVTSSAATPSKDPKILQSPRLSEKAYSPRLSELRGEQSPRSGGRGPLSPRTGHPRPFKLGTSPHN